VLLLLFLSTLRAVVAVYDRDDNDNDLEEDCDYNCDGDEGIYEQSNG